MKSKSFLIASVAGTVVAPAAANAADIPAKAAPKPVAAPVVVAPSWAGLYVGVHAGVAVHESNARQRDSDYYGTTSLNETKTGFIGGGQIGYNLQFNNVVVGVEGDISGLDGKTKVSSSTFVDTYAARNFSANSNINWMATLRGRLGLTTGNLLVFVTGGVAWAEIENNWRIGVPAAPGNYHATWKEKDTKTAGVFGVGAEYMFTPNWTGRLEALFADFGDSNIKRGRWSNGVPNTSKNTSFSNKIMVVRGAVNYKF